MQSNGAKAYIFGVVLAGAAILAYGLWNWHAQSWPRFVFYCAMAVIASRMKVTLSAGAGTMSLSFLFVLIGVASFTLGETLVMGCLAILVQRSLRATHRPTPVQLAFNVASMACSIGAAYLCQAEVGGAGLFETPILMLLAAGAYFLTNTFSVALVIGLTEGQSAWAVWRESYFWSFPNYLVGAGLGWATGVVSKSFGWQATVLILPVLYVIYRSHRMYVDRLEAARRRAEEQREHAEEVAALHRRTIETLALAIEAKDQTTHEHLARVEVYAMEIAKDLGLSPAELQAIQAAALLHDIGKLAVPEYIISKPGKLTPDEFEKMKIHPVVGAELIERVQFPYPVAPIVRCHHEKWDGSGYPEGLSGEQIPIGARILSAVDCLDALASDRQYRRALPLEEALAVVQKESGKSFDPRVVEVLSRRCAELDQLAKASPMAQNAKLSTDLKIERGAKPGAGFEEPAGGKERDPEQERGLRLLFEQIESSGTREELFQRLRTGLARVVPYQVLVVYRREDERLIPEFLDGNGSEAFGSLEIPVGAGLSGWVADTRKSILNGNPSVEPGYLNDPATFSTLGSALAVPLESIVCVTGVLALYRRDRDAFSSTDLQMVQSAGAKMSRILDVIGQPCELGREIDVPGAHDLGSLDRHAIVSARQNGPVSPR